MSVRPPSPIISRTATLSPGCVVNDGVTIGAETSIGLNTILGYYLTYDVDDRVTIGDNCQIGNNVVIYMGATIGDNVVIKDNTIVFSDCTIEDSVEIGANSIINENSEIKTTVTLLDGSVVVTGSTIDVGTFVPSPGKSIGTRLYTHTNGEGALFEVDLTAEGVPDDKIQRSVTVFDSSGKDITDGILITCSVANKFSVDLSTDMDCIVLYEYYPE